MKVLHINSSDKGGGAEDFVLDFVEANKENCKLLVKRKKTNSDNVSEFPKNLLDHLIYLCDGFLVLLGSKKNIRSIFSISDKYNFTYKKLSQLNQYKEADIIHLHNIHGGFFDIEALVEIAKEKPIVWSLHDMWAMTGGEVFTYENQNYRHSDEPSPYKFDYPLYGPLMDRRRYFSNLKKKIYETISKQILFAPGSKWLADCFRNSYTYNSNLSVKVIHEGIDTSTFANKKLRNWSIPRVLIINSKNPLKGSAIFKDVLPKLNIPYELYVIGEKPDYNLKAKITCLPYQKTKNDLAKVFNEVDILIFPSRAENFPLTVSAAMSCGVCVLGSEEGGIPEQLMYNEKLLFKHQNPEEPPEKLSFFLTNPDIARAAGEKLSEFAEENLNSRRMYIEYFTIYSDMLVKS